MIFAAFVVTFFLLGFGSSAANDLGSIGKHGSIYRPVQLSYRGLFDSNALDNSLMLENLSNVGMIAITDMPTFFRQAKHTMQSLLPSCLDSMDKNNSYVFEDGTKRTTIATHTLASGDMAPLQLSSKDAACTGFEAASVAFRAEVDRVTRLFAQRLSELCESDSNVPLLQSKDDQVFATFADIVELGEHLEHFHKYQKQVAGNTDSTIEWHTDQGMFLVFAPGVLVDRHSAVEETVADGFYIELSNGGRPMVQFDDSDDLVVLLGDGIRQVKADQCGTTSLRPLPHALSMPSTFNEIRVWYGRMILAPASAVHPEHEHEGWTFGDLRVRMIDQEGSDPSIMALGCSGSASIARQLEETSCEEGTLYCWHRCMSIEEQNITETLCRDQGLDLRCINPRGQLWDNTHGDWFPGCIDEDTAPEASPYPKLPDYPRDEENCTDAAYADFVQNSAAQYDHMMNLTNGGVLYWTVEDDDTVNGMLSYNGLFGYLALGFAGPMSSSSHNEMVGAKVIMATPSSVYNASHGFDFNFDPTVEEYSIGSESAFRHWQTPLSAVSRQTGVVSDPNTYAVQEDHECFASMTFSTAGIFDQLFNVSGMDSMIWAANGEDMFAGYHGQSRGVVYVQWNQGVATLKQEQEETTGAEAGDENDGKEGDGSSSTSSLVAALSIKSLVVVGMAVAYTIM